MFKNKFFKLVKKQPVSERKTLTDLQKTWRPIAQDHFKKYNLVWLLKAK